MPKVNPVSKAIKEAKFVKALVASAGNQTEAYKAIRPQVKHHSARALGSTELAKISSGNIDELYEKIGCTKEAVITELWKRLKKTSDQNFIKGTVVLNKIAGWEQKSNGLRDLLDRDLDLIEVVKIRLKKRSDAKDLRQVIDVDNTLVNHKTNETATENSNSDEQVK